MTDTDRGRLLQAILANVAFDGWTRRSLQDAARQEGVSMGELDVLFPGGARSVLEAFSEWADDQMLAAVSEDADRFQDLRVREKIAFLVEARLLGVALDHERVLLGLHLAHLRLQQLQLLVLGGHEALVMYEMIGR